MGEGTLLEELSDIAWMKVDAEPLGDDALEVEPTPAHDAVDLTIRARLDDLPGPTSTICANRASCSAERRGFGPSVQLSRSLFGPEALKRWTQSRSVWRSIPPIFAAAPRSIPSLTAASERSRRLWLTFFDRQVDARRLFGRIVLSQSDR
jgi:hypothetical protein